MNGLPGDWGIVEEWLLEGHHVQWPMEGPQPPLAKKWPGVPTLTDYRGGADKAFWEKFPYSPLPQKPTTRVNATELKKMLVESRHRLTAQQYSRGLAACASLLQGADPCLSLSLPAITVPNADSLFSHGDRFTDKLATWVASGIVAGPFPTPPLEGFRSNAMMAVYKHGAVRPVINMSGPKGRSFNDAVATDKLEKVHMTTAQQFGYKVRKAGRYSLLSKFDLRDAYKLVPARKQDWRLQGFQWLGKWFVETQMVFGAIPAVASFDQLGHTILDLTLAKCSIPGKPDRQMPRRRANRGTTPNRLV